MRLIRTSGAIAEVGEAYLAHANELVALATLLTGSRALAEEVVQDVFAAAIPRWATIENPAHYLKRSVVNRVRSLGRRATRTRALPRRREAVTGEPILDETWHLLRRLPPRQRAVLVLRIHLDLPDLEIAQLLGCPEATVRSLAFRALATLRRDLS
jgi:RNA polymerase sigma factor (sigma-70 family)